MQTKTSMLTILAAVLVLTAGCAEPSREARLDRVREQIRSGDYRTARIELLNLVQESSADTDAQSLLVSVLVSLGALQDAQTVYERLIDSGAASQALFELGARIKLGRRDFAALRESMTSGELRMLEEPRRSLFMGEALLGLKSYDELDELLARARTDGAASPEMRELEARYLISQERIDEAAAALTRLVEDDPGQTAAWMSLGRLHLMLGQAREALSDFETALNTSHSTVDYAQRMTGLLGIFDASLADGDIGSAEDALARVRPVTENRPLVLWLEARLAAEKDEPQEAIRLLNDLITRVPADAEAHALLGSLYLSQGNTGLAEIHLREAVARNPNANTARANLAALQLAQGNERDAKAQIEALLRAAPKWTQGIIMDALLDAKNGELESASKLAVMLKPLVGSEAGAYEMQGDVLLVTAHYAEASAAYDAVLAATKNRNVVLKAYQARRLGGLDRPAEVLEAWLSEHADDHPVRFALADYQTTVGAAAAAADNYRMLLEAMPDQPVVLNNLAWLAYEAGDDRALDYARRAHRLLPDNGAAADTLGWLLLQSGDAAGIEYLEKAAQALPDHPEIKYHLAVARVEQGRVDEARAALAAVLELDTDSPYRQAAESLALELR